MKMRKHAVGIFFALLAPLPALAEPVYSMNFLPAGFNATAMNNAGHVAGNTGAGASFWNGSSVVDLGLGQYSHAAAINNRGDIAGYGGGAFLYSSGTVRYVGPVRDEFMSTPAFGLNDLGHVVGEQSRFGGDQAAWADLDGNVQMLGSLPGSLYGWSSATAINNKGLIVGAGAHDGADLPWDGHAFLYQDGRMHDLGTLGGEQSFASDINDMGQVVGWAHDETGDTVPFLYTAGSMHSLGPLDGYDYVTGEARAINNAGMVVGWSGYWEDERSAFLYMDGKLSDLNRFVEGADGWNVVEAYDINDAQQILGKACRMDECLSVRLDLVAAVPEPGGYAMLAAGLVLLAGRRTWGRRESLRFS